MKSFNRWIKSCNVKDIGLNYIIFAGISAILGHKLFIIIGIELFSGKQVYFLGGHDYVIKSLGCKISIGSIILFLITLILRLVIWNRNYLEYLIKRSFYKFCNIICILKILGISYLAYYTPYYLIYISEEIFLFLTLLVGMKIRNFTSSVEDLFFEYEGRIIRFKDYHISGLFYSPLGKGFRNINFHKGKSNIFNPVLYVINKHKHKYPEHVLDNEFINAYLGKIKYAFIVKHESPIYLRFLNEIKLQLNKLDYNNFIRLPKYVDEPFFIFKGKKIYAKDYELQGLNYDPLRNIFFSSLNDRNRYVIEDPILFVETFHAKILEYQRSTLDRRFIIAYLSIVKNRSQVKLENEILRHVRRYPHIVLNSSVLENNGAFFWARGKKLYVKDYDIKGFYYDIFLKNFRNKRLRKGEQTILNARDYVRSHHKKRWPYSPLNEEFISEFLQRVKDISVDDVKNHFRFGIVQGNSYCEHEGKEITVNDYRVPGFFYDVISGNFRNIYIDLGYSNIVNVKLYLIHEHYRMYPGSFVSTKFMDLYLTRIKNFYIERGLNSIERAVNLNPILLGPRNKPYFFFKGESIFPTNLIIDGFFFNVATNEFRSTNLDRGLAGILNLKEYITAEILEQYPGVIVREVFIDIYLQEIKDKAIDKEDKRFLSLNNQLFQGYHLGIYTDIHNDYLCYTLEEPMVWFNNFYILGFFYDNLSQKFKFMISQDTAVEVSDPYQFIMYYVNFDYPSLYFPDLFPFKDYQHKYLPVKFTNKYLAKVKSTPINELEGFTSKYGDFKNNRKS